MKVTAEFHRKTPQGWRLVRADEVQGYTLDGLLMLWQGLDVCAKITPEGSKLPTACWISKEEHRAMFADRFDKIYFFEDVRAMLAKRKAEVLQEVILSSEFYAVFGKDGASDVLEFSFHL